MTAVSFSGVTKSFRVGRASGIKDLLLGSSGHRARATSVEALRDVSFSIEEGESVALLGHNGSGKSTALKLLAGTIQPTSGVVETHGRIAPLLELGAGFHPDLTGRENIFLNAAFLGVPRTYVRKHLDAIIDFSGVEEAIDTPVRFYSSGMYVRLGFAVAIHADPDVVLVDEVLAVGDLEFQAKCLTSMRALRDEGRTVILVTHSLKEATSFCTRGLVLSHGALACDGSIAEATEALTAANV